MAVWERVLQRRIVPTLWGTENGDYAVQGYAITGPSCLAELNLPDGESAVVIPATVLEGYFHAQG
ncbi:hypothetical protein ACIPLC_06710 [Kitasatospora sp. NPDC086801]|uniref:hypothetical protein n=1 Tax=Kitasatospora sp. NPDC086801 TaxID=3364066 RepID=UPI003807093C